MAGEKVQQMGFYKRRQLRFWRHDREINMIELRFARANKAIPVFTSNTATPNLRAEEKLKFLREAEKKEFGSKPQTAKKS